MPKNKSQLANDATLQSAINYMYGGLPQLLTGYQLVFHFRNAHNVKNITVHYTTCYPFLCYCD